MIRHLNRELSEIKYQRDSVCGYLPIAGSKCFDISLLRNLNSHSTLCVSYIFCHKESVKGFEVLNLLQIVISQVHTYLFPHQLDHQHFTVKWRFVQLDVDWINPRLVSFPTGYYWKSYYFFNIFQIYKFQHCSSVVYSIAFVCFKPIWYSLQTKVTHRERLITTCVIAPYLADVDKPQLFACRSNCGICLGGTRADSPSLLSPP